MKTIALKRLSCRLLLALAIALSGASQANAQLRYGLKLGGSFASASLDGAGGYYLDNRSGFTGGLMLEYMLPDINGLGADMAVVYSRYNTRLASAGTEPTSFGRNFIEIPVHWKYKIPVRFLSGVISPLLYTGPDFAFKVGGDHNDVISTKTFQPRWDFGVGVDVVNFIQITGGYALGMGNGLKRFSGYPDASLHTDGWNLSVNILFDF